MTDPAPLPLRRITRSEPIVTSRHLATRPRIGRLVSGTQLLANGLGRPSSVRRSLHSSAASADVRFPQWLLPAAVGRGDDLDPWRDRDLIAIRRARSRNRVVRQVPPRGLPMASHARGRGRLGDATAPSSIARRLQPVRRAPSQNDAHIAPVRQPAVRPASPRPPRARRLALPPGKADRDGPPAPSAPASERTVSPVSSTGPRHRSRSEVADGSSTSSLRRASSGRHRDPATSPSSSSSSPDLDPRMSPRRDAEDRTSATTDTSTRHSPATGDRRPAWTTFPSATDARADLMGASPPSFTEVDSIRRTPAAAGAASSPSPERNIGVDAPTASEPMVRRQDSSRSSTPVPATTTPADASTPRLGSDAWSSAGWRRTVGLSDGDDRSRSTLVDGSRAGESDFGDHESVGGSTLAERVARLADSTSQPNRPGDLVRRSPVSGGLLSAAAALASAHRSVATGADLASRSVRRPATTRRAPSPASGSRPSDSTASSLRRSVSRRPSSRSTESRSSTSQRLTTSTNSASSTRAVTTSDVSTRVESTPGASRPAASTASFSRSVVSTSATDPVRRRQSVRRTVSERTGPRLGATSFADRTTTLPGGSARSPFVGLVARSVSQRQVGIEHGDHPSIRRTAEVRRSTRPTPTFSSQVTDGTPVVTGSGPLAAQSFLRRLEARSGATESTPRSTGESRRARSIEDSSDSIRRASRPDADTPRPSTSSPSHRPDDVSDTDSSSTPRSDSFGPSRSDRPSPRASELAAAAAAAMSTSSPSSTVSRATIASSVPLGASTAVAGSAAPVAVRGDSSRPRVARRSDPNRPLRRSRADRTSTGSSPNSTPSTPTIRIDRSGTAAGSSGPLRPLDLTRAGAIASRGSLRRSVSAPTRSARTDASTPDLPVAPVVVAPSTVERRGSSDSTIDTSADSTMATMAQSASRGGVSIARSSSTVGGSPAGTPTTSNSASRSSARRVSALRRSSIRRSSPGTSSTRDEAISADAMARMLENGFEPTPTVERTSGSLVRRSVSVPSTSHSSSSVRRSRSELSVTPSPSEIVNNLSTDGPSGSATTSQVLDLMDWINRIVDERLRSELERRGIAGGRW